VVLWLPVLYSKIDGAGDLPGFYLVAGGAASIIMMVNQGRLAPALVLGLLAAPYGRFSESISEARSIASGSCCFPRSL